MSQRIREIKHYLKQSLRDPNKPWAVAFQLIEEKSGVQGEYAFIGFSVVVGFWLVFGYAAQLLCNAVGFIYPAYASMHAIESSNTHDDTKWLTYWVIFAIFSIFEYFADIIVGWFPLYWLIKCIFFVWLMLPNGYNGSLILYNKLVRPYFLKHHGTIDGTLNQLKENAAKLMEQKDD